MKYPEIAKRLSYARKVNGLSQQALATKAGIAQSTVGNIEAGERERPREITAIAKALGFNAEWLLDGTGPERGEPPPELEWPFELITRREWSALTERQRGVVEWAARKALQDFS
jgi:transcriptional regulator with XRE-family HTH domain